MNSVCWSVFEHGCSGTAEGYRIPKTTDAKQHSRPVSDLGMGALREGAVVGGGRRLEGILAASASATALAFVLTVRLSAFLTRARLRTLFVRMSYGVPRLASRLQHMFIVLDCFVAVCSSHVISSSIPSSCTRRQAGRQAGRQAHIISWGTSRRQSAPAARRSESRARAVAVAAGLAGLGLDYSVLCHSIV